MRKRNVTTLEYHELIFQMQMCKDCKKTEWGNYDLCKIHQELWEDFVLYHSNNILNKLN